MGILNFFRSKPQPPATPNQPPADIPKHIFVEDSEPNEQLTSFLLAIETQGIVIIYNFLQADYEKRGYDDALTNPDENIRVDGIKVIKLDLKILAGKVNNLYHKRIKDLNLHIETRKRAGLIDLVTELESEKEKCLNDVQEIKDILNAVETDQGVGERIILSYHKGFMKGLLAITQSKVLK